MRQVRRDRCRRNRTERRPTRTVAAMLMGLAAVKWGSGCWSVKTCPRDVAASRAQHAAAWERQLAENSAVPSVESLSLERAIELALRHNPDLQAVLHQRDIARGRVLESYGQALPRVSLHANYARLDEVNRLEIGGRTLAMGFEDNYALELAVQQPLFHGGAIPAALSAARLYARWSEEGIRSGTENVIFQTARAYYDLQLAERLLGVHEQAVQLAERLLGDARNRRRTGLSSDYDVLRAEVEVANARTELIRQRNGHHLAVARLLRVMGLPQERSVSLSDELTYEEESWDEATAIQEALRRRPDLVQAELLVRMQREAVRAARSAYVPKVDAFLTQKWANPDPHAPMEDDWNDAWTAGVAATLNLFDGFERRGKVVQATARLREAEAQLRAQEETVALEVRQALLSLRDSAEWVQSQRLNLQRAKEGLRLAQAAYREGTSTQLAVLDAQTALTRTQALYYQALHAHTTARLSLYRAMGRLAGTTWVGRGKLPALTPPSDSPAAGEEE